MVMWWSEMCVDTELLIFMLLFHLKHTSQRWPYKISYHKMAVLAVSLICRTTQFTIYFRLLEWPSDGLSAMNMASHVSCHSCHSLSGEILLWGSNDQCCRLLPSGTCLLPIPISGTATREGVALLRKEGFPCLAVDVRSPCVDTKPTVLVCRSRQNKHYPTFINSSSALADSQT
jgi:hypothetical protein